MSLFHRLPNELVGYIVNFLDWKSQCNLYLYCGKDIKTLLCQRKVLERFELDSEYPISEVQLQRLLEHISHFSGLKVLKIHFRNNTNFFGSFSSIPNPNFPRSLRSIDFSFPSAGKYWISCLNAASITNVRIEPLTYVPPNILGDLPPSIKSLCLCPSDSLNHESFNMPSLTKLDLSSSTQLSFEFFNNLKLHSLTKLGLCWDSSFVGRQLNLPNIKSLKINLIAHLGGSTFPETIQKMHIICTKVRFIHFSDFEEIAMNLPRKLKKLSLTGQVFRYETTQMVPHLPPELTYLSAPFNYASLEQNFELPQSLQTLRWSKTDIKFGSGIDCLKLPKTLTHLEMISDCQNISELPRNLKILKIPGDSLNDSDCAQLPPNLTLLSLPEAQLTDHTISLLPKSLTSITLKSVYLTDFIFKSLHLLNRPVHVIDLACLIWAVESLLLPLAPVGSIKSWEFGDVTNEIVEYLPDCLKTLNYSSSSDWDDQFIEKLPRKLEHLRLFGPTSITETGLRNLPPQLQTLDIPYLNIFSEVSIVNLPKTLEKISTENFTFKSPCLLKPSETVINEDTLKKAVLDALSREHSVDLILTRGWKEELEDESTPLPQELLTINLPSNNYIGPGFIKRLANSKLIELSLPENQLMTDMCIEWLPRTLKKLILSSDYRITDLGLMHLPSTLTELDLAGNTKLTDTGIKHLPPTLLTLNMNSAKLLTDACVKNLPRGLLHLYLASAKLTAQCASDLPQNLKTLHLENNEAFSNVDVAHLPQTLTSIKWPEMHNHSQEYIKHMPNLNFEELETLESRFSLF